MPLSWILFIQDRFMQHTCIRLKLVQWHTCMKELVNKKNVLFLLSKKKKIIHVHQKLLLQWSNMYKDTFLYKQPHARWQNWEILWMAGLYCPVKVYNLQPHRMKSHLSVDWMVTEWWLNGDWMMTGKVDFSRISVTIQ